MPALDAVRLHLWSIYGTTSRFARELNIPQKELELWLKTHQWDQPWPRSLHLQNKDLSQQANLQASKAESKQAILFVNRLGQLTASPAQQSANIHSDDKGIHISFSLPKVTARNTSKSFPQISQNEQWFWNGDFVPLKNAIRQDKELIKKWSLPRPPPIRPPLLDDCAIVLITPVDIGKDRSWRFPQRFVPDGAKWSQQTKSPPSQQIELEGIFYAIAVNSKGDVLKLFYDPWDGGIICPAWPGSIQISSPTKQPTRWQPEIFIPWKALKPNVNEDSIWAVDLVYHSRSPTNKSITLRSPEPTLIRYDLAPPAEPARPALSPAETSLHPLNSPVDPASFPTSEQWQNIPALSQFSNDLSQQKTNQIKARISHDRQNLFIRFDCKEKDLSKLKVVGKEAEIAEYGAQSRRLNYLDRREQFGLDWGDYVEINLAPNLDDADRFHGGLHTFLVNSKGALIERYSDSFGMFNVPPHPLRSSGAKTRVTYSDNTWTVDLSIPLASLCGKQKVSASWGLNLQRCMSASITGADEAHFSWSPISPPAAMPGWKGSLRYLRDPQGFGLLHVDPKSMALPKNTTPLVPAIARSPQSKDLPPLTRQRHSDRLNSVYFVDNQHGWAVGGLGTIVHSSDGGQSWQNQTSPSPFILEKVFFINRQQGWIVGGWPRDANTSLYGGMGVILATSDGGKTWIPQIAEEATWLKDVFFINSRLGWAVGEYGVILKTEDGGQHWQACRNTHTASWLYGLTFLDEKHGFAVGHDESILTTDDGGENWKPVKSPVPSRVNHWPSAYRSVAFSSDGKNGWIIGEGGAILQSYDGGYSWQNVILPFLPEMVELLAFDKITITDSGKVWLSSPFAILSKANEKSAWNIVKTGQNALYRGIHFSDDQHGWISGERGTVLATQDGGLNWTLQKQSPRKMGLLYATAHDHHINNGSFSITSESFDTAYINPGRGVRAFELNGYYNRNMVAASAMTLGVSVVHSFTEYSWRERNRPDAIAQRYQNYGGIDGLERRLVAMIRSLRPPVLIAEQPVTQEDYYAHGVGEVARALIAAFDSAADPDKFPELNQFGLEPYAPAKLYIASNWITQMYRIHPATLTLPAPDSKTFSERLGSTYGAAKAVSRNCFWGLLDRSRPPRNSLNTSNWNLHLKKWRGSPPLPDNGIYDHLKP
ncbi:MAG: YCF48-related protein [Verrucomicrobiota bacterium]